MRAAQSTDDWFLEADGGCFFADGVLTGLAGTGAALASAMPVGERFSPF